MGIEGSSASGTRNVGFAERLSELKSRGSAVLVTGADTAEAHVDLCGRMFGDHSVESRRRVLVITDGTVTHGHRMLPESGAVPATTVVPASVTRGTASATTALQGAEVVEPEGDSLGHLGLAITEAIEHIESCHAPLTTSELRLGVDSVAPLLDAHGEQRVFEFLAVVTRYLTSLDALGHAHLPLHRDAYVARLLAPLFDVVVEVRIRDGQPQQRWHLDDETITSRWLRL